MVRSRLFAWWVVLVAVVVAGCSSGSNKPDCSAGPTRTLDTTAPPGSVVATDPQAGYAIALPESWKQLPLDLPSFDQAADELQRANPNLASPIAQLRSVVRGGGPKVVAINPTDGSTMNLIGLSSGGKTPDETAKKTQSQLRGIGAKSFVLSHVVLGGEPAVRQNFTLPFPGQAGPIDLLESQFYLVRKCDAFILTLTGTNPDLDSIANSLKLA